MIETKRWFLTYTRELEAGVPVEKCPVVGLILTDTMPELSVLGSVEPCQYRPQESSSSVPSDSDQ